MQEKYYISYLKTLWNDGIRKVYICTNVDIKVILNSTYNKIPRLLLIYLTY